MEHSFSIKLALHWGWQTLKARSTLIYQVLFTILAVQVAYSIVTKVLAGTAIGFLAAVVLFVAGVALNIGATLIALRLAEGEAVSYSNILPTLSLGLRYLGAQILSGLIIVAVACLGVAITIALTLLAAVGGHAVEILVGVLLSIATFCATFYFALRYSQVGYAILDGARITESLSRSAALMMGQKWHFVLFMLALIGINILGAIALLVGLLVSIPVSLLAAAHVYVQLKGAPQTSNV